MKFKRVYLVNDENLHHLIEFATKTKGLINKGQLDVATNMLENFIRIIERTKEDKNV